MVHDWVVVGGIHGTHIALRLRDRASIPPSQFGSWIQIRLYSSSGRIEQLRLE